MNQAIGGVVDHRKCLALFALSLRSKQLCADGVKGLLIWASFILCPPPSFSFQQLQVELSSSASDLSFGLLSWELSCFEFTTISTIHPIT